MPSSEMPGRPDPDQEPLISRAPAPMVRVKVLGPLQVLIAGQNIPVKSTRLRALLAVLAMSVGRSAPPDRLAAAIWGEDFPGDARRAVQLYIARLRGVLGAGTIRTTPTGYELQADDVDASRFVQLLEEAASETDVKREIALLQEALRLWRGAPFEGIQAVWLEQVEVPRLVERYLAAVERRIDLEIAAGQSTQLVGQLRELTTRYPLRERFWGQLMTTLYRSGRQADALESYQRLYRLLADDLGLPPSAASQELHQQILAGDAKLRAQPGLAAQVHVPRQLPATVGGLSGRSASVARLDTHLNQVGERARVVVIAGGAGVGKTTLAVHWAHRVADKFPDGQLYVDLRGFDPSGQALEPGDAIRDFLQAFGISPSRFPTERSAQEGLFRSVLAGRRVLLLLDNARNPEQVRPLLPGGRGCAVVVTTRSEMSGLVAEGAHRVTLGPLSQDEARQLLASRLGHDRVAAEKEAADGIIAICAGLPLALVIAAARGAMLPQFSLEALVATLQEFQTSLDAFAGPDAATDIRALFSWSYDALSSRAQRLLRLLSIHPGTDIAATAAATIAGVQPSVVRPILSELRTAHLLTERLPTRYTFHDTVHCS
jgi:DNA-binding SARP family transcriptional activator